MKIPAHTKKLADTYFADQNKRLGEIERDHGCEGELVSRKLLRKMTDKDLYNQAADIVINEKLGPWLEWAKEDSEAKRSMKQLEETGVWVKPRSLEASHQRVLKDNPLYAQARQNELDHERMGALIAKDHRDGLAIEDAIARGDLKPRTLDEVYGDLKRGKRSRA